MRGRPQLPYLAPRDSGRTLQNAAGVAPRGFLNSFLVAVYQQPGCAVTAPLRVAAPPAVWRFAAATLDLPYRKITYAAANSPNFSDCLVLSSTSDWTNAGGRVVPSVGGLRGRLGWCGGLESVRRTAHGPSRFRRDVGSAVTPPLSLAGKPGRRAGDGRTAFCALAQRLKAGVSALDDNTRAAQLPTSLPGMFVSVAGRLVPCGGTKQTAHARRSCVLFKWARDRHLVDVASWLFAQRCAGMVELPASNDAGKAAAAGWRTAGRRLRWLQRAHGAGFKRGRISSWR